MIRLSLILFILMTPPASAAIHPASETDIEAIEKYLHESRVARISYEKIDKRLLLETNRAKIGASSLDREELARTILIANAKAMHLAIRAYGLELDRPNELGWR